VQNKTGRSAGLGAKQEKTHTKVIPLLKLLSKYL
jgi:hypothetical protein